MALTTSWVGREAIDAIADIRTRCYGNKPADRESFLLRTQQDRFDDGDVLLARDGDAVVGTATHLSLTIAMRGVRVPCQGVAWVGTTRSHRRRKIGGHGVATTVMRSLLGKARERGDLVTALMPFRASFYEHFGYGVVEWQNVWTVPLSILPNGETGGFREATAADVTAMAACRTRQANAGQCDVDDSERGISFWLRHHVSDGFTFVDAQPDGTISSIVTMTSLVEGEAAIADVETPAYDSPAALRRVLAFLGTLRDQYSFARIHQPADFPLPWLLAERQVAHRRIDHPAATCKAIGRMQLRVLDHVKLLEALPWPSDLQGKVAVAIAEPEGGESRVSIDVSSGRAAVKPAGSAGLKLAAATWAAVATGGLTASAAAACGLIEGATAADLRLLDGLAVGPAPFTWEYF